MISEGFGSSGTIRGLRENRILTEGFAWANTELRVKLVNFKLFNQYFYIALNPFFDAGVITKPYRTKFLPGAIYDEDLKDFDFTAYRKYLESDPKNAATLSIWKAIPRTPRRSSASTRSMAPAMTARSTTPPA